MQGGIHPDLPGSFYFDLVRAVKERVPGIHLHAFSPMEILNGATKLGISFREFLAEAKANGLDTIPGTAAEILDDDIRWSLTKGKLPADTWEEIIRTAHGLGIRSSSTIMFGHVDAPPHWVAHIRRLASIQSDTGGFTEFVPLPFVHRNAPIYLAGKARPGPSFEDDLRMHAVARVLLDGLIHNVQVSWVKLGVEACQRILQSGANDFGGTLDGGNDQPDGRGGVGDRDDTRPFRRRDPRDRACPGGAKYDLRPHRSRLKPPYVENPSSWLTVSVNQLDHHISPHMFLSARLKRDTMTRNR